MAPLPPDLRTFLVRAIRKARRVGESGARQALRSLAVDRAKPFDSGGLPDWYPRPRSEPPTRPVWTLRSDSTPAADSIEPVFEVATEDFVFGIGGGFRPGRTKASHQSGDPIGGLERLIAVALDVKRRFNEAPATISSGKHAAQGSGDQRGPPRVFVENEDELRSRLTVQAAEIVDALDRLTENVVVEPVRIVVGGVCGLLDPDVEDEPTERCDLVEQPVRQLSEFDVLGNVRDRVEAGPFLLPHGGVSARAFDLEREQVTLALEEPGSEATQMFGGQYESRQAEDRAVVVYGVLPRDVGADVAEFVEVSEVRHRNWGFRKHEGPCRSTGLGKRAGPREDERLNTMVVGGRETVKFLGMACGAGGGALLAPGRETP